jgi:hypothetical protein
MVKKRIKKRWSRYAGAAAIIIAAGAGIMTYSGGKDAQNPVRIPDAVLTLLLLDADLDFGRLPAYTGTWDSGDHCWNLGPSGTITDDCGSWDLTASGSPRTGVVTGVPVDDGSGAVDWDGESAAYFDGGPAYYSIGSTTHSSDTVVSVSAVVRTSGVSTAFSRVFQSYTDASNRWSVGMTDNEKWFAFASDGGTSNLMYSAAEYTDGWHCVTWVIDTASADSGAVMVNGIDDTDATTDDFSALSGGINQSNVYVATENAAGSYWQNGISRIRVDYSALSLAQHKAFCGSLNQPVRSDHPAVADISWTQTGGSRCFDVGSNRAYCAPGGKAAYAYSSALDAVEGESGFGWAVEPGRINRVTNNTTIGASWTVQGTATATDDKVAPDGSATAAEITSPDVSNSVYNTATGYTNDASLYPRFWVKCSSGDLALRNISGGSTFGLWIVTCATASAGQWVQIYDPSSQAGVAETYAWIATAGGGAGMQFYGSSGTVTAQVWQPTLTETDGLSTIPTGAAAVDTGSIAWTVAGAEYNNTQSGRVTIASDYSITSSGQQIRAYTSNLWWVDSSFTPDRFTVINSSGSAVAQCNLDLSGAHLYEGAWNATSGSVSTLIDSILQACPASPSGPWIQPSSTASIDFSRGGSSAHAAIYGQIKIEDRP